MLKLAPNAIVKWRIVDADSGWVQYGLPYIFVEGVSSYVNFLISGLGGSETGRTVSPDGQIANCRIRFGTATIMVSEASQQYPASQSAMYLYVDDVEAALQRALDEGAELEMSVSDMPYGDRQCGVRDPAGNLWWLSQRLVDEPYDP